MSEQPRVLVDYEFIASTGQRETFSAEEGKHGAQESAAGVKLEAEREDGVLESLEVYMPQLFAMRITRRILQPETQLQDPQTKVVEAP
jgi:hypothetical protein